MKKIFPLLIGIMLLGSLNSCDWIRSRLGMPTSVELKQKKEQIIKDSLDKLAREQEAARLEQFRLDSLARIEAEKEALKRYHVVLGSFIMDNNAKRMMETLTRLGYQPKRLEFRNGYSVISAYQSNSLSEAYNKMYTMFALDITPYDVWVYDTNQNLHF
ncbi:MAG TPA: hypothetical protein PLR34_04275 [Bacteroidales bacterium]|jgi:hypothetical protein|nr:hypothetical protein [Bacteroidales bacterium]OQC58568.1 MAG: hypothetical protein BWX52_00236 [Bacteroidetes bacterium ADurb.Bin013]MBP8999370.1 hypothetical protein [Bacteroidales bacterium]MBV6455171.1 hypothetical protein [Bacteroidales bacterium]MCZ2317042.1 hypothetical protein [Bacteroidales bacterium]